MTAFTALAAEIAAITEDEVQAEVRRLAHVADIVVEPTQWREIGQVSLELQKLRLLAGKRFAALNERLRIPAVTNEEHATRVREHEELERERKTLDDLFKILVAKEVPEAGHYYSWVHHDGKIFVNINDKTIDEQSMDYLTGKTTLLTDL